MSTLLSFSIILAWIFGIISTLWAALLIFAHMSYSEFDKLRDNIRGYERVYNFRPYVIVAIVCWAWILSQ